MGKKSEPELSAFQNLPVSCSEVCPRCHWPGRVAWNLRRCWGLDSLVWEQQEMRWQEMRKAALGKVPCLSQGWAIRALAT